MKRELLARAYAFLDEMAPPTKSITGRVTSNVPEVSRRGSMNASKIGKSANTMTRKALSTAPVGGRDV